MASHSQIPQFVWCRVEAACLEDHDGVAGEVDVGFGFGWAGGGCQQSEQRDDESFHRRFVTFGAGWFFVYVVCDGGYALRCQFFGGGTGGWCQHSDAQMWRSIHAPGIGSLLLMCGWLEMGMGSSASLGELLCWPCRRMWRNGCPSARHQITPGQVIIAS